MREIKNSNLLIREFQIELFTCSCITYLTSMNTLGPCPTAVVQCVDNQESRSEAPWSVGQSICLSAALTSCLPTPALPLWPPSTSSVQSDRQKCAPFQRGVWICPSGIVLSWIHVWLRPRLTYVGRREEFPMSAYHTFLPSVSVCRAAVHAFPSSVCVCCAHSCSYSWMSNVFQCLQTKLCLFELLLRQSLM